MPVAINLEPSPTPDLPDRKPALPRPQLPNEVLLHIFAHTAIPNPCSPADKKDPRTTLRSLALVSREFYRLALVVLHRDLVLPTATHTAKLLELVRDPAYANHVAQNVRSITFGTELEEEEVEEDEEEEQEQAGDGFAVEVLRALRVPGLRRVEFKNLTLTQAVFANLQGLHMLELSFARLSPAVRLALPNLACLMLEQSRGTSADPNTYQLLLSPQSLPALRSLRVFDYKPRGRTRPTLKADRHAALRALAPQLTELILDEEGSWLDASDNTFWPLLANLKQLGLGEPAAKNAALGQVSAAALRSLPSPLATLEFWTAGPTFAVLARNLERAFAAGHVSVSALRYLDLPNDRSFEGTDEVGLWVLQAVRDKIKGLAEARGVTVCFN